MNKKWILILSVIFMVFFNISPAFAMHNPRNTYEVKSGDTLWKIAVTYGTTVNDLKLINGLQSPHLFVGQKLKIIPTKLTMNGQFVLMTREQFRDWLFNQKITRKITFFQEHRTWWPSYKDFNGSNHFSLMYQMKDLHVKKMGWSVIKKMQEILAFDVA